MGNILINCPTCSKSNYIDFSEDLIKDALRGILAVNIEEGTVCKHSFIAYIDKNLAVRDYFVVDFKVELPELPSFEKVDKKIPLDSNFDLTSLKLNFHAIILTSILRAIFIKQKLVIIIDHLFLKDKLKNFLEYITQNTFISDIIVLTKEEYKKDKKKYNDYVIIKNNAILNDKNQIFNSKKLRIESLIIRKFLAEYEYSLSIILLKNEIYKAYSLAKDISEKVRILITSQKKRFSVLELAELTNNYAYEHNIKLSKDYLYFLIDIIINYFDIKISEKADLGDFLRFL